jgi:hypothetical protein
MPAQARVSARLVWNFAHRFCPGARNSRKTGVASCVVFLGSVFLLFFAARATAAYGGPANQANTPPADSHATAAPSPDDAKQPANAGSDDAKADAEKKDTPSPDPKPASAQGESPRTPPPATEPGQMYFELRYTVDNTDIQGNRDRSFLHPGINHTAEFSFFTSEPMGDHDRLEILGVGRYTNNPQVDPQRNSLQRAYVRLQGPSFEVNVGDALINFSRLSFNQNVKGLTVSKKLLPRLKVIGTVGFFIDRWASLYRNYTFFLPFDPSMAVTPNPDSPGKPYTRFVAGTRVEQQFGRGNWIAMNWSHGKDLQQSLPGATLACIDPSTGLISIEPLSPGCAFPNAPPGEIEIPGFRRPFPQAVNNDVLSADANEEYVPWHFGIRGEFAYSWSSGGMPPMGATSMNFACAPVSPIVGADVLDARCFSGQVGDWAGRFEAHERIKRLTLRTDYSRFEPNFFSANARQISDLQDFTVRGEYELTRNVSLVGSWRRSNDNLNGERNFTNVVRAPEGRLVLRDLPFNRRMTLEMGYRERNLDTPGNPGPLDVQKRSTRIPFLSLIVPMHTGTFSFDYEHRHEINAVTPQLATDTDRFAVGYRAHYTWDRWEFSPTGRFEIERLDKSTPLNAALAPTDVTLLFPADFFSAFDTNRTIQAGFLLDTPQYFRIEGSFKEFNGLALSPLQASAQFNPQLPFLYFNQGFRRPSWRGAVTYKIRNDENRTVTAFYVRTNNFFPTGDPTVPDTRSFRETVIGGSIVLRFRK